MKTSLGSKIRELREGRDFSLREFAKKLDTSAAHVSDIELGRRFPSEELLEKMARLLRIGIQDLKAHDYRPPVEEIKRISESDPAYGFAFRRLLEKSFTAEELHALVDKMKKTNK